MIKMKLIIETDRNQAFSNQRRELSRILKKAGDLVLTGDENTSFVLRDINGNTVGNFVFKLEQEQ